MTARQLQIREKDSQGLRVLRTDDGTFCVESAKGKIMYLIAFGDDRFSCTCTDYTKNIKQDAEFKCKHVIAVEKAVEENQMDLLNPVENQTPKLDERFITTIKGKDFVVYAGLLSMSHCKGIKSLTVEILQYPTKENGMEAVCRAILESKAGDLFSEVGHASPKNVNRMVADHILHMAATRSKARVMRDFTNVGLTALEELADADGVIGSGPQNRTNRKKAAPKANSKPAAAPAKKSAPKSQAPEKATATAKTEKTSKPAGKVNSKATDTKTDQVDPDGPPMSEAQKRALMNLSRRRSISVEDLEKLAMEDYGKKFDDLTSSEASAFIRDLQSAA